MSDHTLGAYNIAELRAMAERRVPKGLFEFVDRGSEDEVALKNNRAAFERIKLKPRALVDVSKRSQAITLFGRDQKMPIAIAPTGTAERRFLVAAERLGRRAGRGRHGPLSPATQDTADAFRHVSPGYRTTISGRVQACW